MDTKSNIDNAKLRSICKATHSAEVTITSLAMRERLRHTSDIVRLKTQLVRSGEKIVEEDYMRFWKELEAIGIGSIVYGRKGKADRWEWHYNLKSIAKAVIDGSTDAVEKIEGKKRSKVASKMPVRNQQVKRESRIENHVKAIVKSEKIIFIPLRSDCDISINLPANITKEELAKINYALQKMSS